MDLNMLPKDLVLVGIVTLIVVLLWKQFSCFTGKAGTGMDREVSLVLKHGAEAKDYDKVIAILHKKDHIHCT